MQVHLLNLFIKLLGNMKLGVTLCTLKDRLRICKVTDSLR